MKMRAIVSALALVAVAAFTVQAVGGEHKTTKPESPGLAQFKQLAGDWVGKFSEDGKTWLPATVKYAVTSNGTTVVETLGPGTPHEMVTVIHQDGKDLGLTHYCSIGNQPHMKAKVDGSNKFAFEFTNGSNIDADTAMYMSAVTYTLVDKDTLKAEWTNCQGGKASGHATFEFKRKK